jgi:hypothetical protein
MPSTSQPAPEADEKKSRGLGSYVLWGFVVVVVYVLSSGPAMSYCYYNRRTSRTAQIIYGPIGWAAEHTALQKPLGMYWHLWCPEFFDRNGNMKHPL